MAGLLIAWAAAVLAKRAATRAHSWGLGRATIMAAMLNALAILIGVVWVIWEASQRFQSPVEVPGLTILIVALVGIGVNTGSALLFMRAQKDDLNAKGAFLHMAADAAVSGAVVLAAAGILLTGWTWLDPAVAIAVSLLIAVTAAGLFRDVHDLHIWPLSTTRTALAVHVVSEAQDTDAVLHDLAEGLEHGFGIAHSTIQVEREPCGASCLRPIK